MINRDNADIKNDILRVVTDLVLYGYVFSMRAKLNDDNFTITEIYAKHHIHEIMRRFPRNFMIELDDRKEKYVIARWTTNSE